MTTVTNGTPHTLNAVTNGIFHAFKQVFELLKALILLAVNLVFLILMCAVPVVLYLAFFVAGAVAVIWFVKTVWFLV